MKILIAAVMLIAIAGLWQYNKHTSAQSERAAAAARKHQPFQPFDPQKTRAPMHRPEPIALQTAAPAAPPAAVAPAPADPKFSCDGRTHCSQMRSCSEATYFLQHCPNAQMDGNNDGVPCERQWCN